jgi:hypothetical protein
MEKPSKYSKGEPLIQMYTVRYDYLRKLYITILLKALQIKS